MAYVSHWRERAHDVISAVIAEVGLADLKKLKKALRAAYPFGPREYHPYKIWLSEVRFMLGNKKQRDRRYGPGNRSFVKTPGQKELF